MDFRDADSIMTPFDFMCPKESSDDEEKVEGFKPDNSSWEPNARVWGCERPSFNYETHAA